MSLITLLKKVSSIFLLLVTFFIVNSCSDKFHDYEVAILKIIESPLEKTTIVIPGEGCGGCISGATYFVRENISQLNNSDIIFTGVQDKKLLRNQLGSDFLSMNNVYIDNNNLLMAQEIKSVYPYILWSESNEFKRLENFSEDLLKTNNP